MTEKIVSQVDDETIVITSNNLDRKVLEQAVLDFEKKNNLYSVYPNETGGMIKFKAEDIDNLAYNAQSDLKKIEKINAITKYFVSKNEILGLVYEAIEANVNSDYAISYPSYSDEDKESFDEVDNIIKDFNEKIDLENLIVTSIPMTYLEGNYVMYLRDKNNNYHVDYYPLGIAEIADYSVGGNPYVLININELRSRLSKVYKKTKKNKALFYENMDKEVEEVYPSEVVKAYKEKEQYAKLDIENSGVMRINNFNRKYGLTPIFKSLKSTIRLENIEVSDDKNTLVRGKKILFQKLAKELLDQDKTKSTNINWLEGLSKAHLDLMASLNADGTLSVYTGMPWTESLSYIEPKIEPTNVQVKNNYKTQIMTSVGISFLSADKGSYGASQISVQELLRVINRIGEQLERILEKWYKKVLIDNGFTDSKYCPKIRVLDSEKLDAELSLKLAKTLHSDLNASLETAFNLIGIDVHAEARRRKQEEELGYNEIFTPRLTAYTNTGDPGESGRPSDSKDLDKQNNDKDYNKENNR